MDTFSSVMLSCAIQGHQGPLVCLIMFFSMTVVAPSEWDIQLRKGFAPKGATFSCV